MAAAASGFLALGVFLLVGLLIIAAIVYALILLAIEYWYISAPVISLIIFLAIRKRKKNRKKQTTYQYTNQQNSNQNTTQENAYQHTSENNWSNNHQYRKKNYQKNNHNSDYSYNESYNKSSNSQGFGDYWEKWHEIQERRDAATEPLWEKYYESAIDDDDDDSIWNKINEIDEIFDQEEDELWEKHMDDRYDPGEFHEEYERKTRDGSWERDKAYEKSWNNWQKAKKDYEDATGQKYSSDWYENFNWDDFLGEESVNIDECYKTLGLSTNATMKEVKIRYRELALKHHPDRCEDKKQAEEKFKEIAEAYEQIKKKHMEAQA